MKVQKEEIELLMAQISDLQGSEASLTNYELPAVDSHSDEDGSGIPAGHEPEEYKEYEVDDKPSWES